MTTPIGLQPHAIPGQHNPPAENSGIFSSCIRTAGIALGVLSMLASYAFLDPLSATLLSAFIGFIGYSLFSDSGERSSITPTFWQRTPWSSTTTHTYVPVPQPVIVQPPPQRIIYQPAPQPVVATRPNPRLSAHALPGIRTQPTPTPAAPTSAHAIPGVRATTTTSTPQPPPAGAHAIPGVRRQG